MARHERLVRLLLGIVVATASVPAGAPAGAETESVARTATLAEAGPPAPQWVGGTDVRGKAQLTWIRDPAFATVRIYRRDEGPQTPFRPLAESVEGTWVDDSVQPGATYRYRLTGIGRDGREGRPSSELAVRIGTTVLRAPAPPDVEWFVVSGDAVNLRWSEREGEDVIAWNIYRKTAPEVEFRLIGSTRGTTYHDAGLEPGRLYVYTVTALDSDFNETAFSKELPVTFERPRAIAEPQRPKAAWKVRRTRLVAVVGGGRDLAFERPADVAVGPLSGSVYVADSGRNLVFVFSPLGGFDRLIGATPGGESVLKNVLGLATDHEENLYVVDAGTSSVQVYTPQGRAGRRLDLSRRPGQATGLIDAVVGSDGRVSVVDNFNNQVSIVGLDDAVAVFGRSGAGGGEFSAPTFCALDGSGRLYVADCLNARVQVFTGSGEFVRAFGRAERGPGGFGRPKGIAVSAGGEIYVADSWLNTIQVFDAEGRFVAILGDEEGKPLDLGSPNGVALGPGNRIYVAERLASRLQIRELIDAP